MSLLKNHDKKIREVIENKYSSSTYDDHELSTPINDIAQELSDLEFNDACEYIVHFIYFSNNKYSFSYKRKHSSKKDYHETILLKVKNHKTNENNIEPTSEELDMLEKEIFQQTKTSHIKDEEEKNLPIILSNESTIYKYPTETSFKKINSNIEPQGTQWVHDVQYDDVWTDKEVKLEKQFKRLRAIILPEQRSKEWFEMRDGKITASDGGTVIDLNHHEPQYKFILKKTIGLPFISNVFVYHGKKLEEIAVMIYEYRMNVKCEEFGLIGHPKYKFLGASPDSIVSQYKLDGKHKTKYIGRMLEIKCPYVRKINMDGPIIDHICPIYYWVQVQLQLECCDLDECDFWQCEIREYDTRDEFIEDTNPVEPFRSIETGFEKGCLIQLIPKTGMKDVVEGKYDTVIWDTAKFIYPPKIEMTPYECDIWIAKKINELNENYEYNDYCFDKIIYWKLVKSKCVTIHRDKKWFAENLPTFQKMWNYVEFFRKHKDKLDILVKYIDSRKAKKNKDIMNVIEKLYQKNVSNYEDIVQDIVDDIEIAHIKDEIVEDDEVSDDGYMFVSKSTNNKKKEEKEEEDSDDGYMFVSKSPKEIKKSSKKEKTAKIIQKKKPVIVNDDDDDYPFL